MSVATLGLAVSSETVVSATKALNDLTAAAKPATAAAADLSKTSAAGTGAITGHAKAMTTASAAAKGLSFEARNLSFQLVDVGQGLLMGQSPFMIFAQQAGQVGQIIGTTPGGLGGLMKELGSSVAGLITPMRLAVTGIVAIGAAVGASVLSWKSYALQLDDVRRIAGTTSTVLAGLNSAAAVKGIGDDEFFSGMKAFSQSVYEAKINAGSLIPLLRANGAAATDVQGTFGKVADLVKNAKDDVQRMNILQQAGLPATRQWLDFMSQGGAKIQLIAAGMKTLGGPDNDAMIAAAKKFDEKWNEAWRNISNGVKSFGLSAITTFDSIANSTSFKTVVTAWQLFQNVRAMNSGMIAGGNAVPKVSTPTVNPTDALRNAMANRSDTANSRVSSGFDALKETAPKTAETVDPNAILNAIRLEQQHIGLLGQTATAADAVRSVELQVQQARLAGVSITQKQVDVLKQLASENTLGITQMKAQTDAYNVETATIGMSVGQATAYAAAQNAINDAKRAGRALTQDNIASINAQSQALGDAAAKADLMNTAYNGLVRGPLQTLTSQIANGAKFFDALKSAGISALNAIASKLADMAAQSLWSNAMGGASGGGGLMGILGKALGIGGGEADPGSALSPLAGLTAADYAANGKVFDMTNVVPFARGGAFTNSIVDSPTLFKFAKGTGMMGEAGPEAIMPLTRGPNGKLGVAASGGGAGGQNVHVTVGVSVDENGNLQAYVKDVAQSTTAAGVSAAMTGPGFTSRVAKATKQARSLRQIA